MVRPELFLLTNNRRFRWAYLVHKEFSSCFDHESMREVLENLPTTLEDTYANVLSKKIPERHKKKARLMLMWLAHSIRPLRLRELAFVASLPEPEDVMEICTSSLVTRSRKKFGILKYEENDDHEEDQDHREVYVEFDHFSVKEYLVSERHLTSSTPTASWFYVSPMLAHLRIAETCISTLLDPRLVDLVERHIRQEQDLDPDYDFGWWNMDTGEDDDDTIFPLLEYSLDWHLHVQEADSMSARSARLDDPSLVSESEMSRDQIHKIFCDENQLAFRYWAGQPYVYVPFPKQGPTAEISSLRLCYASYFNLLDSVRRLLKPKFDPAETMGVVSTLSSESEEKFTPLTAAGIRGNLEIVNLLLSNGIRIDQSEFEHMIRNNERDGIAVMTSILKAQPDLSITDDTVVAAASNYNTKEFVKLFLNNGFLSSKARLLLVLGHWYNVAGEANTGLMEALVKHGEDIGCTSHDFFNVYVRVYGSRLSEQTDLEVMLERYEPLSLSQDITECIAAGNFGGVRMLRRLCQEYKDISFSQDLLAAAASKDVGMYFVDIILEYDKTLNISQLVVQAAARSLFGHLALFAMMHHNKSLEITWDFLKSTVSTNMMNVLMDHEDCGFRYEDDITMDSYELDCHGDHEVCKLNFSKQMLQAAARWEPEAIDYLQSHARPNITFTKYALQD